MVFIRTMAFCNTGVSRSRRLQNFLSNGCHGNGWRNYFLLGDTHDYARTVYHGEGAIQKRLSSWACFRWQRTKDEQKQGKCYRSYDTHGEIWYRCSAYGTGYRKYTRNFTRPLRRQN